MKPDDADPLPRREGALPTFDGARARRADQTTVRRANLGVVLRHIASASSCSRADVAAGTGLTRGTVSSLVNELLDLELVRETGETTAPRGVGRPGVRLELADVLVGVGLEVNVDYVAVSVEDLTGAVRYERRSYGDNRGSDPGPVLDRLADTARVALDATAREGLRPIGISVAVPGLVEEASGTLVFAPNLGWHGIPVGDELEERLGLPVHVENESNLAALAEHWTGAAVGIDDFVCVFGEVGVGGGVVLGGRLFRGTHGFGGEFGHVSVDADGRRCACGSRGCVETLVGQESIAAAAGISTSGRTRSLNDELVRRATDGSRGRPASAERRGPLAGHRARVGVQRPRSPGSRARGLFRTAFALARRRGSADARGAVARGPVGVVRRASVGVRRRRSGAGRGGALAAPRAGGAVVGGGGPRAERRNWTGVRVRRGRTREGGGDRAPLSVEGGV